MINALDVANLMACQIELELKNRGMKFEKDLLDTSIVTPRNSNVLRLQQLYVTLEARISDRTMSLEDYHSKIITPMAALLGIKLARPVPFKSYKLEILHGVVEAVMGQSEHLYVRLVTDYCIKIDALITRFDMLIEWADVPWNEYNFDTHFRTVIHAN